MQMKDKLEAIRTQIKTFPTGPGLYFMKGPKDKVLYIGKAKNLRSRVAGYFQQAGTLAASRGPKIAEMINKVETVDFLQTKTEVDAMLAEARLIKDIHPPYNSDLVDDKTFPYLEITTGDDFPGVYITRKPRPSGSRLFGPFAGAKDLRQVFVEMQKIFRFRSCNLDIREDDPKRRFFRPCILYSIRQCVAPCAAKIDKVEYKKIITDLVKFLRSKRSTILRQLKTQMAVAAAALQYEKAAMYRDRIRLIERLERRGEPDEDVQPEVFAADPTEALVELQNLLKFAGPVRIIEGIDVADIGGTEAVGSLVKFIDGRSFKAGYRRFKIKTVKGIDDYAMIAEVVKRRYKYALRGEELWPDLILIDGGLGHLHAAESALKELFATESKEIFSHREHREFVENLKVGAIAKREEEIYLQGSTRPLKLSRHSPVLKLLQYVRDEAHRFAQHYFHILQRKKLLSAEDAADIAAAEKQRNEPRVGFDDVVRNLRKKGKL
jgi:excinuclease ABC subunit C